MNETDHSISSIDGLETFDQTSEERIRRPPNAFMIFGQQYRKVLANQFQNLSNKQISKLLGNEWKKMEPMNKEHYHTLAREAYQTHLAKYPSLSTIFISVIAM